MEHPPSRGRGLSNPKPPTQWRARTLTIDQRPPLLLQQLGINRVAQASSVNVIPLVWTDRKDFEYFPLDEDHPTRVDEPYGLSKLYVPDTPPRSPS